MDRPSKKSFDSTSTTTSSIPSSQLYSNSDKVNYVNFNYVDTSETTSQERRVTSGQKNLQNNQRQQPQPQQSQECQQNGQQERQEQKHQSNVPNEEKPSSHKMSPPTAHVTRDSAVVLDASMTLQEMGFNMNNPLNWNRLSQPAKTNLYTLLQNMIEALVKPNVQIRIGTVHFNCHLMVLQCYSDFFMDFTNELLIQLPEEQVTPAAFMMSYEWMLSEQPLIQREGIVELLKAAKFLRIKTLVNQCWEFLDDDRRIQEHSAYFLYMEARHCGGLENLEHLMIPRISKFFLSLVASYDFLCLTVEDVILLFRSNFIAVSSETEVFMSAVRWLNHNWANREQHVVNVMKTVRFGLMPPYFLMTLTRTTDCIEIDRILEYSEVKKMIMEGMTFSNVRLYYINHCEHLMSFLKRYNLAIPLDRHWVRETECCVPFGDPFNTYKLFLYKLQKIQAIGKDYGRTLEFCYSLKKDRPDSDTKT